MRNTETETLPYRIGPLLLQAHRRESTTLSDALEPLGIQRRHFHVLQSLSRQGPCSQRELIDRLDSDNASMVRAIDELEARGLCKRLPVPTDRRAHSVSLTPTGRRLAARAQKVATAASQQLLNRLSPTEQHTFFELLTRFTNDSVGPQV